MITEQDLKEAIAECQGQRNPNANTCIKLAAFLTIQRELYGEAPTTENQPIQSETPNYSFSNGYDENSELMRLLDGRDLYEALPLIDELLQTLRVVNERLYNGFVRRLVE